MEQLDTFCVVNARLLVRKCQHKNIMYSAERASPPSLLLEGEEAATYRRPALKVSNCRDSKKRYSNTIRTEADEAGRARYTTPCKGDLYCRRRALRRTACTCSCSC